MKARRRGFSTFVSGFENLPKVVMTRDDTPNQACRRLALIRNFFRWLAPISRPRIPLIEHLATSINLLGRLRVGASVSRGKGSRRGTFPWAVGGLGSTWRRPGGGNRARSHLWRALFPGVAGLVVSLPGRDRCVDVIQCCGQDGPVELTTPDVGQTFEVLSPSLSTIGVRDDEAVDRDDGRPADSGCAFLLRGPVPAGRGAEPWGGVREP